jgi:hypothetical protein
MPTPAFVHIGLVEDLDETVRFLALLGFDYGEPGVFGGEWIDRVSSRSTTCVASSAVEQTVIADTLVGLGADPDDLLRMSADQRLAMLEAVIAGGRVAADRVAARRRQRHPAVRATPPGNVDRGMRCQRSSGRPGRGAGNVDSAVRRGAQPPRL